MRPGNVAASQDESTFVQLDEVAAPLCARLGADHYEDGRGGDLFTLASPDVLERHGFRRAWPSLQGARAAAITESTSRATIFIGAVSAGLVALGLIATATRIGTAFYAFGLILLSTLSFIGFVTLDRVLQSGIEELHYVERIARLRAYYFDFAPELTHYLASVPQSRS